MLPAVVKLRSESLKSQEELFAYVVDLAADGPHYPAARR
jgi:hypothetical protein